MRKRFNIFLLCVLLIGCMISGVISATAKQSIMSYISYGNDGHLGSLLVGEKVDIDISQTVDYKKFYSLWTNTDEFPEPYWTSSNSAVASVDGRGIVTAKSVGVATILATFQHAGAIPVELKFTVSVVSSKQNAEFIRYHGSNRYLTANAISDAGWPGGCKTVVLANSMQYADALVGVPLAVELDAPILLTSGKASLEESVYSQIKKLKAKDIIILGGNLAVSTQIEDKLKKDGYNVLRCYGANRYKTAIEIAKYTKTISGKASTQAFIATSGSYADALSISPYAAMKGYPILYVDKNAVNNQSTYEYLEACGFNTLTILGGTMAVNEEVETALKKKTANVKRIFGGNRYETSVEVAKAYLNEFSNDIVLATALDFPDALAGGVFAAKKRSPILLVNNVSTPPVIETFIRTRDAEKIYILGGDKAIPQSVVNSIYK